MDSADFNHIPYNQLTPEQQEARKAARATLVEAAKKTSRDIDNEYFGTIRGLNILKEEDADGWIAGQVWDKSELSRQIILSNLHEITLHFLGLSPEAKAERIETNKLLVEFGEDPIAEPLISVDILEAEADDLHDMITEGVMEDYGVRCEIDEDYPFILNLVKKEVIWENDEEVMIIKLSDPDFNLIIDFTS